MDHLCPLWQPLGGLWPVVLAGGGDKYLGDGLVSSLELEGCAEELVVKWA